MQYVISREYSFSAAHILPEHFKCSRMHGHNYRLVVHVGAPHLVGGMVVDFSNLDTIVDPIVEKLDHRFIITRVEELGVLDWYAAPPDMLAYLPIESSTAELIASWIGEQVIKVFEGSWVELERIELWETAKSCAIWTPLTV